MKSCDNRLKTKQIRRASAAVVCDHKTSKTTMSQLISADRHAAVIINKLVSVPLGIITQT